MADSSQIIRDASQCLVSPAGSNGRCNTSLTVTLGTAPQQGLLSLIAANGDSIYTTVAASSEMMTTPGVNSITEINTITGGTGRFSGAQGSFTVEQLINLATGFTSGSFHGTMTSPGAAKH